jgi:hypothetical protein
MVVGMNPPAPVVIEPMPKLPSFHSIVPKHSPLPKVHPFSADNIATITQHLKLLSNRLSRIAALPLSTPLLRTLGPWPLNFCRLCHPTRWSAWCTVRGLCLRRYAPAIGPTVRIPKLTGLWRSFIVLLAAVVFAITRIFFRPVLMANGSMWGSFLYCWAPTRQSLRLPVAAPSIAKNPSFLISFTPTLLLGTASWWVAFDIP